MSKKPKISYKISLDHSTTASDVFKRIQRENARALKSFEKHPYFPGDIEHYTILDIYTQGFRAGMKARGRKK